MEQKRKEINQQKKKGKSEQVFKGLPISAGVAIGKVCLFNEKRHSNLPIYKVKGEGREYEFNRFGGAVNIASQKLAALIDDVKERIGAAEAEIFVAQKMILEDSSLSSRIENDIREGGFNAEAAVMRVLDSYEERLREVDNSYIKERASDIGEVKRRLLDVLSNMNPSLQCSDHHCQRGKYRLVVAEELTPSLTVELETQFTLGFVTERGGVASHAAILAQGLGIPAVSGISGIHSIINCGTEVIIDGNRGVVIVWPSKETIAGYPGLSNERRPLGSRIEEPVEGLCVMANINLAKNAREATLVKAEGVGLYRTEFEFFAAQRMLGEDEQYECYRKVAADFAGRSVTYRLLDIGGDKGAVFFNLPKEENPYLGLRGTRFLLSRPEMLKTQARALARVSRDFPIKVLYPMIVDAQQFDLVKGVFSDAVADLDYGSIEHGAMFEVPSACLDADRILSSADFGSIGTNDLVQYLFAVDRNNEHVAADYNPDRTVFWNLIESVVKTAVRKGKTVSVCGQTASDPVLIKKLVDCGVKHVSVGISAVAAVRRAVRESL